MGKKSYKENHAMRGPHAGRRKWSDFYEGIPTDSTRSSAYVRVRTWTPRIFHAAEYVRTRTYACGLHAFSMRPNTYVRVRTHVDSTHFPRGRIRTYAYVRMWTPRIRIFRILLRIFRILLRIFRIFLRIFRILLRILRILLRIFRIMARLGPMARYNSIG